MLIILLRFTSSAASGRAKHFMAEHKEWLKRGFEDGVFLLAGSLEPGLGGAIVAVNASLPDLETRLQDDPFGRKRS